MATLVTFHAHPDDEAIATGGTMAKAAADGHRVVLVVGTRGERGEVDEGYLADGEELWQRRVLETHAAADALGVSRVEFLGYVDSGMAGEATNEDPACFWQADIDEAAARLAAILVEERADVLTVYDERGVYLHPDHIQVHRVGLRAAEMAGTQRVYMNTTDKDAVGALMAELVAEGIELPGGLEPGEFELGVSGDRITTMVDVKAFLDHKRTAMAAHASQISETSFFLSMPPDPFARLFGHEQYIRVDAPPGPFPDGPFETSLFDGLEA